MVWEEFARSAYLFLSDTEVMKIKEYVPQAINSVAYIIVAETGVPAAFMGIEGTAWKCCSFPLRNVARDSDVSSLNRDIRGLGIAEVIVNEQDPQAVFAMQRVLIFVSLFHLRVPYRYRS